MIRINFALRKGPIAAAPSASSRGSSSLFPSLGGLFTGSSQKSSAESSSAASQDLAREVLTKVLLVACVYFGGDFVVGAMKDTELEKSRSEASALQNEVAKLNAEVAKRVQLENEKKKIEEFEKVLSAKLETIEKLMIGRDSASNMFKELSGFIPPEVWLSSFSVDTKKVTLRGRSIGIDAVTTFLAAVNASPYYVDGQPRISEKKESNSNQVTQEFELTAGRKGYHEP